MRIRRSPAAVIALFALALIVTMPVAPFLPATKTAVSSASSQDAPTLPSMASSSLLLAKSGLNYTRVEAYLVTGQKVTVLQASGKVQMVEGAPKGFSVFSRGNETFIEPSGVPSKFDSSLFDVSSLSAAGMANRVPLLIETQTMGDAYTLQSQLRGSFGTVGTELLSLGTKGLVKLDSEPAYGSALFSFLASDSLVVGVHLDAVVKALSSPSDNGGINLLHAVDAWNAYGVNGSGIKIAILDTGIYQSPDFQSPDGTSKIIFNIDLTGDGNVTDLYGHGTHVAGIAAGTGNLSGGAFMGIAPGALLINIKVLNSQGMGYDSWIIDGIQLAMNEGANIISMSLGGTPDSLIDSMVNYADSQGVLVVVAAGNDGPFYWTIGSPAEASGALTVGADVEPHWESSANGEYPAYFTSLGPESSAFALKPDLMAPGWQIISDRAPGSVLASTNLPYPGYGGNYMELSGTSMATPFVSGAAALLMQAHPGWTISMIKDALESTASLLVKNLPANPGDFIVEGVPYITPYVQGEGRIDVLAAMNPEAFFLNPVVDFGNVYKGAPQITVSLFNPTDATITLNLTSDATNANDGTDASSYVSLSQPQVTIEAGGVAGVTLSVSTNVPSSVYGGYVYARDAITGALVAHAAFGFYGMRNIVATIQGADGSPLPNAQVIYMPYNSTFFQYDYPYIWTADANGIVTIPAFKGLGVLQTMYDPQCAIGACEMDYGAITSTPWQQGTKGETLLLSGIANVTTSDVVMTLGGSSLLPVTFDTGFSNTTVTQRSIFFMTFGLWNAVGGPSLLMNPTDAGARVVEFMEPDSYPADTTFLISPNSLDSFLSVGYEYGYSTQVNQALGVISPTDFYSVGYQFFNVTHSIAIKPDLATLSTVRSTYFGDDNSFTFLQLDYGWSFQLPTFHGMDIFGPVGGALIVGTPGHYTIQAPIQVTQHVTPGQSYYGTVEGQELYEFTAPAAGQVLYDYENANPFTPDLSIWNCADFKQANQVDYCVADLLAYPRNPASGYATFLPADQTSSIYVNGVYVGSNAWTHFGSYSSAQVQVIANTTDSGSMASLSTSLYQNVTFNVSPSFTSVQDWYPGAVLRNVFPSGRTMENLVPAGPVSILFQASVAATYAQSLTSVDVQYSLDGGSTWAEATGVTGVSVSHQGILDAEPGELPNSADWTVGIYNATLGTIPSGNYVALKFTMTDSSGGTTTDVITRAFYVTLLSGFPNHTVTFSETGLPTGAQWMVDVYGPSSVVEKWTNASSVSLDVPDGQYEYLVEIAGPDYRLTNGGQRGAFVMSGGNAAVSIGFASTLLYGVGISYSIVGGGSGVTPPTVNYTAEGGSRLALLGTASFTYWMRPGSTWTVTDTLVPSGAAERWQIGGSTSGSASSPSRVTIPYYHQYQVTWIYNVVGSSAVAPTALVNRLGSPVAVTANSTTGWFDSGASYSFTNPLGGSTSSQRWYSTSTSGTISGAGKIAVLYYYQLGLTLGYSVAGGASPPSVPDLIGTQNGAAYDQVLTQNATVYFLDANTAWRVPSLLGGSNSTARWATSQDASGTLRSSQSMTLSYFFQYNVSFAYASTGGGPSLPPNVDYTSMGILSHLPLAGTPTAVWADGGSNWSVPASIDGGGGERWITRSQPSGATSAGLSLLVSYFHQYQVVFGFTVQGGTGGSTPPSVNYTSFGALASSPTGTIWVDAGTGYAFPSMLTGSGATERWVALDPTSGNATRPANFGVSFDHQFLIALDSANPQGGSVQRQGGWYEAGSAISVPSAPATGWSLGQWQGTGAGSYTGTDTTATVHVQSALHETAYFYPGLSISVVGPGSVTVSYENLTDTLQEGSDLNTYATPGDVVTVTATPSWFLVRFAGWSPSTVSGKEGSFSLGSPTTLTATFEYDIVLIGGIVAAVVAVVVGLLVWRWLRNRTPRSKTGLAPSPGPGAKGQGSSFPWS